ncbi:2193_t:CDS:1, partial [Scutellospora calospora]
NKPFKPVHTDFILFVANTKNKNTQKMLQSIATSTDNIPSSPTPVTHQHSCQKCQQPISCKVTNNQHKLSNDATFQNNNAYHYTCLTPKVTETSTTTDVYATSSTSPIDYASTRKNFLATF